MEIHNDTPFATGSTLGLGPDGAPCLTVVVKATFTIPRSLDGRPEPAPEQMPVASDDVYHDGDVTGSLRLENDLAPFKPKADVVLVGTAYAPGGRPVPALDVLLRVGSLRKVLRVFGDRTWLFPSRMVLVPLPGEPKPFTTMPLTYERAFGGIDRKAGRGCDRNYVGKGFLGRKTRESVHEAPLPNVEDPARLIASWDDEPMPAGFGFFSPHWQPRARYRGTPAGMARPHPLFGLPADFRHEYYNGAHPDLQVPGYLRGDEPVELVNLTPDGPRRFRLPGVRPVVSVARHVPVGDAGTSQTSVSAHLDTLVLLPDDGVFFLVWRAVYTLGSAPDVEALKRALLGVAGINVRLDAQGSGSLRQPEPGSLKSVPPA